MADEPPSFMDDWDTLASSAIERKKKEVTGAEALRDFDSMVAHSTGATRLIPQGPVTGALDRWGLNIPDAIARGYAKGFVGPAQAIGDIVAPETTSKLTAGLNQMLEPPEGMKDSWGESIGEAIGQVGAFITGGDILRATGLAARGARLLPGFLRAAETPLQIAVKGAGVGATAGALDYQPSEDSSERLVGRAVSAGIGAVTGGAVDAVGSRIIRGIHGRKLKETAENLETRVAGSDPLLGEARQDFVDASNVHQRQYENLTETALASSDRMGPRPTGHLGDEAERVRDHVESLKLSRDTEGSKAVKELYEEVRPLREDEVTEFPTSFGTAKRHPDGTYWVGSYKVDAGIVRQTLAGMGVGRAKEMTFRDMFKWKEKIDAYLKKTADLEVARDPVWRGLKDLSGALQTEMDANTTPTVRRQLSAARKYYGDNLEKFDSPTAQAFLKETDPLKLQKIVSDVVSGDSFEAGDELRRLMGPGKADSVRDLMIKNALTDASSKDGFLDPATFVRWFDRPGSKAFQDTNFQAMLKGFSNLMRDGALKVGHSHLLPNPWYHSAAHAAGSMAWAGVSLFHGNVGHAVEILGVNAAVSPIFNLWLRARRDKWGKYLLAAAATAKPGSPRMANIIQNLVVKLGPVAMGQAGARGYAAIEGPGGPSGPPVSQLPMMPAGPIDPSKWDEYQRQLETTPADSEE